jgi:PAS domain S-box-containing protein
VHTTDGVSEAHFRVLADAIPVIIWTATADGSVDWYNAQWYAYTGLTFADAAGWGWQRVHHPDELPGFLKCWTESIAGGTPLETEVRLRGAGGDFRWFLIRIVPVRDSDGAPVRWYGSIVDIHDQKRALERTQRITVMLQEAFIPRELPRDDRLQLDAIYVPAEREAYVGGDWYDVFRLPDGRLAFSIGDVAGHGVGASLIVGQIRQSMLTLAMDVARPAEVLERVNRLLTLQHPDALVTALFGFISPDRTSVTYSNAGHPPPIVAGAVHLEELPRGGLMLGVDPELRLEDRRVDIRPGTMLVLYTDGLVEFDRDIPRAESNLAAAIGRLRANRAIAHPAGYMYDAVVGSASPRDDVSVLVLDFAENAAATASAGDTPLRKVWRFHSSDAYTAAASRRELAAYLRSLAADAERVFSAELVIGEILANTVEHAPGMVEVTIDWRNQQPRLTVRDSGPRLQYREGGLPADAFAEGGRGLFLIRSLAEDVHVQYAPGFGTTLRATLPIARALRR